MISGFNLFDYLHSFPVDYQVRKQREDTYFRSGALDGKQASQKEIQAYTALLDVLFSAEIQANQLKAGDQNLLHIHINWTEQEITFFDETGAPVHVVDMVNYPNASVAEAWEKFIESTGQKNSFAAYTYYKGEKAPRLHSNDEKEIKEKTALQRNTSSLQALSSTWDAAKKEILLPHLKEMEQEAASRLLRRYGFIEGMWRSTLAVLEERKKKITNLISRIESEIKKNPTDPNVPQYKQYIQFLERELKKCEHWKEGVVDSEALCWALLALPDPRKKIDQDLEQKLTTELAGKIIGKGKSRIPFMSATTLKPEEVAYIKDVFGQIRLSREEYGRYIGDIKNCKQKSINDYFIQELANFERSQEEYNPKSFLSFFSEIYLGKIDQSSEEEASHLRQKIEEVAYESKQVVDPIGKLKPHLKGGDPAILDALEKYITGLSGKGKTFTNQKKPTLVQQINSMGSSALSFFRGSTLLSRFSIPVSPMISPHLDRFLNPTIIAGGIVTLVNNFNLPGSGVLRAIDTTITTWFGENSYYKLLVPGAALIVTANRMWKRFVLDISKAGQYQKENPEHVKKAIVVGATLGTVLMGMLTFATLEMTETTDVVDVIGSYPVASVISAVASVQSWMTEKATLPAIALNYGVAAIGNVLAIPLFISNTIGQFVWNNPVKSQIGITRFKTLPLSIRSKIPFSDEMIDQISRVQIYLQLPQIFNSNKDKIINFTTGIFNAAIKAPGFIYQTVTGAPSFIYQTVTGAPSFIYQTVTGAPRFMMNQVISMLTLGREFVTSPLSTTGKAVSSLASFIF